MNGQMVITAHNERHPTENEEITEYEQKHEHLNKRLKALEGRASHEAVSIQELSLVQNLVLPSKFIMPQFDKFNGIGDPLAHLRMFVRMMAGYTCDENLLIHSFQNSLSESARRWYNRLSRTDIQSWEQLARAFLKQYELGLDMTPDRLSLQNLEKKPSESFRQYAMRWKNSASEIQPPLTEKEASIMFVNTLQSPYYEKLIMNVNCSFADLVLSGEVIESVLKVRRSDTMNSHESEEQIGHNTEPLFASPPYHYSFGSPISQCASMQSPVKRKSRRKRNNHRCHYTQIPITYGELYPKLLRDSLITPEKASVLNFENNKLPVWYDPTTHCEYHGGMKGHSIEKCFTIKKAVQELINSGKLSFD